MLRDGLVYQVYKYLHIQQGYHIYAKSGSGLVPIGQDSGLLKVSDFSTFWVLKNSGFIPFDGNLTHSRDTSDISAYRGSVTRDVKCGIQIGSDWPNIGTNLGLFNISFH